MLDIKVLFTKILQCLNSLGAAAFKSVANNLTTSSAGTYVLDAYQGKVLNDKFGDYVQTSAIGTAASKSVANNLTTASAGSSVLDAYQGKVLNDKFSSYLPKSGGTATGNITVNHSDTTESDLRVQNSAANGVLYAGSNGTFGLYNSKLGHDLITENSSGTVSIHGWTNRAIANNLTTTSTGSVLDAYQRKVLADKLTVNSKTYTSTYTSGCQVVRVGKVAVLKVSGLKGFTSAGDYTLFTLDAEYRPGSAYTQDCVVAASNVAQCMRVTINTDGKVVAHNYNARTASDVVNIRACILFICAGT